MALAGQQPTGLRESDFSWPIVGAVAVGSVGLTLLIVFAVSFVQGRTALVVLAGLLGVVITLFAHAAISATAVALVIDVRHPRWTFLGAWHHAVLAVMLVVFVAGAFTLDSFVYHQHLGGWADAVFTLSWLAGLVGGGIAAVFVASPDHLQPAARDEGGDGVDRGRGNPEGLAVYVIVAALGVLGGVGVVVAIAYLRNTADGEPVADPPVVDLRGTYVALGDSYSAGEGLRPFSPHTDEKGEHDGNECHRSNRAYAYWLVFSPDRSVRSTRFVACSGAITADATKEFQVDPDNPVRVDPQLDGEHDDVGLVTITMGGNDVQFSRIVNHCLFEDDCLDATFVPENWRRTVEFPVDQPLEPWAKAMAVNLAPELDTLYGALRRNYPKARIVVIGYPYLLPGGAAGVHVDDCNLLLRQFDEKERTGIRRLQDQFSDLQYELAVKNGIEFVSPNSMWAGHEPCGDKDQYTNSIKPIFATQPLDGGSYHPNVRGQEMLGRVVACYLKANHDRGPDAYVHSGGGWRDLATVPRLTELASHDQFGLVDAPGSRGAPLGC